MHVEFFFESTQFTYHHFISNFQTVNCQRRNICEQQFEIFIQILGKEGFCNDIYFLTSIKNMKTHLAMVPKWTLICHQGVREGGETKNFLLPYPKLSKPVFCYKFCLFVTEYKNVFRNQKSRFTTYSFSHLVCDAHERCLIFFCWSFFWNNHSYPVINKKMANKVLVQISF